MRRTTNPDRSGPAFPEVLSGKRDDHAADAVAETDVQSQLDAAADPAPDAPAPVTGAADDGSPDAAPSGDGTAQGERGDAQNLPTTPAVTRAPISTLSAESGTQPTAQAGAGPAGPVSIEPPAAGQPLTPQPQASPPPDGAQPQVSADARQPQGLAANPAGGTQPVAPSPAGAQPAATQPAATQPLTPQTLPTHGTAEQTQAPPAPPGPVHVGTDTHQPHQHSTGNGEDTRYGGEGRAHAQNAGVGPAVGRAMQVQAAVAVENVTGQLPPPAATPATLTAAGATTAGENLPPALSGSQAEDAATTGRVIRGLTAMLHQRGGSMTMRLDPPALGQLRVQMTIARGAVTAEFQPGTAEAQALLDRSLSSLRSALESQGLTVERLTVHAPPGSTSARETAEDQSQQQQQSARHQSDAGDGRSRGRDDETGQQQQEAAGQRFTADFAEAFERATDTETDDLSDRTGAQAA